jgi:hypothetical protein
MSLTKHMAMKGQGRGLDDTILNRDECYISAETHQFFMPSGTPRLLCAGHDLVSRIILVKRLFKYGGYHSIHCFKL